MRAERTRKRIRSLVMGVAVGCAFSLAVGTIGTLGKLGWVVAGFLFIALWVTEER